MSYLDGDGELLAEPLVDVHGLLELIAAGGRAVDPRLGELRDDALVAIGLDHRLMGSLREIEAGHAEVRVDQDGKTKSNSMSNTFFDQYDEKIMKNIT